jgi:hypothetical protein
MYKKFVEIAHESLLRKIESINHGKTIFPALTSAEKIKPNSLKAFCTRFFLKRK